MKQDKFIEVTARWKFGLSYFNVRTSIHVSTIAVIEQLPEETPEYQDGIISRIHTVTGGTFPLSNGYDDVMERIKELEKETL